MHQPNDAPPAGRHEHVNVSIGDCGLCGHGWRTVQSVELSWYGIDGVRAVQEQCASRGASDETALVDYY
jgi:hypothetical protein